VAASLHHLAQGAAEHKGDTTHQRHLRAVAALGPLVLAVELGAHADPRSPKHALARGHTSRNGQDTRGCRCGWGRRAAGDIVTRSDVAALHYQSVDLGIAADLKGPPLGGPSWRSSRLWMTSCGRQTVAGTRDSISEGLSGPFTWLADGKACQWLVQLSPQEGSQEIERCF